MSAATHDDISASHPSPDRVRNNLPSELKAIPQWVGWRYQDVNGKPAKVPYSLHDGGPASTRDPSTWASYRLTEGHQLIGFVFTREDPYTGIDLDECRDPQTGALSFVARVVIRYLKSYAEVSPSGRGVKIIVRATLPGERRQNRALGVEMYGEARFFALTGHRLFGAPSGLATADLEPLHRWVFGKTEQTLSPGASTRTRTGRPIRRRCALSEEEILRKARTAVNAEKFLRLWSGDIGAYETPSEADFALCAMLAYWTDADPGLIEDLFGRSGLVRPKWRRREDYRRRTIAQAIASLPVRQRPRPTGCSP